MNRLLILTILIFGFGQVNSQTIEIGQEAEQIKRLIEWRTNDHNRPDSYGNRASSYATWDVNYYNGQITEVIQCYQDAFLIDFRLVANFCKYYIMEQEKLAYILTQYENISIDKLQSSFETSYGNRNIEDYYFSKDYKHYSRLYLAKNGYATVEWRKTNEDMLPADIKTKISLNIKKQEEIEKQRQLEEEKKKQKENEIKSKTYDLFEYNKIEYNEAFENQKQKIENYFKNKTDYYSSGNFPTFMNLEQRDQKYERFKNKYAIHYKLKDHSRQSVDYGYYIEAGSRDIRRTYNAKLIEGTDENCSLFKSVSIKIPTIEIEGYEVMTEVLFNNINVDFTRGITVVKIKNGNVEFKKYLPELDIQKLLTDKLNLKTNGRYIVKYEVSDIMGDFSISIETD